MSEETNCALHVILRRMRRRRKASARMPQDDIKSVQPFTFSTFQLSSLFTLHASLYRSPKCLSIFFPKTNLSPFHPFTLSTLFTLHPSHLTLIRTYRLAVLSPLQLFNHSSIQPPSLFTLHSSL